MFDNWRKRFIWLRFLSGWRHGYRSLAAIATAGHHGDNTKKSNKKYCRTYIKNSTLQPLGYVIIILLFRCMKSHVSSRWIANSTIRVNLLMLYIAVEIVCLFISISTNICVLNMWILVRNVHLFDTSILFVRSLYSYYIYIDASYKSTWQTLLWELSIINAVGKIVQRLTG